MTETRAEQRVRAGGGGGRRARRGLVLGGLALLLVAFVGLGSRSPLWDIGGPPRVVDPESYTGDMVIVAFALLLVLPIVLPALRRRRRRWAKPEPELEPARVRRWVRILAMLAIPAAIGVALLIIDQLPGAETVRRKIKAPRTDNPVPPVSNTPLDHGPPIHWWGYTLLALVLLGGLATAWYLRERREPAVEPDEPDELLAALDLSLEDIESDADPRRAVIRAYARMEKALGSYGLARRPSETPLEYLARALTSLRVGRRSVERLSALFERAKFSQHEIDLSMKSEALAALGALRDELAGAAA